MKFVNITTFYPGYLNQFYAKHPGLENKSYAQQKEILDYDAFGWADFWFHALTPMGYEVLEITANAESMQRVWALENKIPNDEKINFNQIALKQIKRFRPEIIWFKGTDSSLIKEIRSEVPSIRLVLGWVGSAFPNTNAWQYIDLVLSCAPESVERLRSLGCRAEHLHHGFDPIINTRIEPKPKKIDISFIGQILRSSEYHLDRDRLLEQLVSQTSIQIFSPSVDFGWLDNLKAWARISLYAGMKGFQGMSIPDSFLQKVPVIGKAAKWTSRPKTPVNSKLKPFLKPAVFGLEMYQTLLESKMALNIHADSSPTHASNMRLFETTGVGTCLVTDWKPNLGELFEPDREVVTYRSAEECVDKVKWLLEHPTEREEIARAGQSRTLKDHSFAQRAVQLDQIIRRELSRQ